MSEDTSNPTTGQGSRHQSEVMTDLCCRFVRPFLEQLHLKLDRRLVQTCLELLLVMVMQRHRNHGLFLSKLGGYLLGEEHAPAGTKRISNLLYSPVWNARRRRIRTSSSTSRMERVICEVYTRI